MWLHRGIWAVWALCVHRYAFHTALWETLLVDQVHSSKSTWLFTLKIHKVWGTVFDNRQYLGLLLFWVWRHFQNYTEQYRISLLERIKVRHRHIQPGLVLHLRRLFRTKSTHLCINLTRHEGDFCNIISLNNCCMTIPQESWSYLFNTGRKLATEHANMQSYLSLKGVSAKGYWEERRVTWKQLCQPKYTPKPGQGWRYWIPGILPYFKAAPLRTPFSLVIVYSLLIFKK